MRAVAITALLTLLSACATVSRINSVSVGMTKSEVLTTMGKPHLVSATENVEYLRYRLYSIHCDCMDEYFVRLVGGRVEAFGRMGDFDSTKAPTVKVEKDVTIRSE